MRPSYSIACGGRICYLLKNSNIRRAPIYRTRLFPMKSWFALPLLVLALFAVAVAARADDAQASLVPAASTRANYTDLWHSLKEPGSGVFVDHQGETLFAAVFTHDASGAP